MNPELVNATLKRKSSVDNSSHLYDSSQEKWKFDQFNKAQENTTISHDESQTYTFIIEDIVEPSMMLPGECYDYINIKSTFFTEDIITLPGFLNCSENEPNINPVITTTTSIIDNEDIKLDAFNLPKSANLEESEVLGPVSVIVKNVNCTSANQSERQELSGGGVDIAALVDMCFEDEILTY